MSKISAKVIKYYNDGMDIKLQLTSDAKEELHKSALLFIYKVCDDFFHQGKPETMANFLKIIATNIKSKFDTSNVKLNEVDFLVDIFGDSQRGRKKDYFNDKTKLNYKHLFEQVDKKIEYFNLESIKLKEIKTCLKHLNKSPEFISILAKAVDQYVLLSLGFAHIKMLEATNGKNKRLTKEYFEKVEEKVQELKDEDDDEDTHSKSPPARKQTPRPPQQESQIITAIKDTISTLVPLSSTT